MNALEQYFEAFTAPAEISEKPKKRSALPEMEADGDVVKLVHQIFEDAFKKGASDIHLEPKIHDRLYMRLRIDGQLTDYASINANLRDQVISCIKVMSNMDITVKGKPQDGKINLELGAQKLPVGIRVATFPTAGGLEDVVMRILPPGKPVPLKDLGLHPQNLRQIVNVLKKPHGIILVCGGTGSGKTTTLHSFLDHLNKPQTKIWTAEDPVEITQDGLRQVQISPKANLDYATVLRSFLRGDPDIIMFGEMRDRESIHIGLEASLTGHLVLSTMHTNSGVEAITRCLSMGINPFNLSDALLCAMAQRLERKLCPRCKEPHTPTNTEKKAILMMYCEELDDLPIYREDKLAFLKALFNHWRETYGEEMVIYKARGCSQCDKGFRGRLALHELMINSVDIRTAINNLASSEVIRKIAFAEGMISVKMDAVYKALQGDLDFNTLMGFTTLKASSGQNTE